MGHVTTAQVHAEPATVRHEAVVVSTLRTTGIGVFLCLLGVLCSLGFGLGAGPSAEASFTVNYASSNLVPPFTVHTEWLSVLLGIVCFVLGAFLLVRPRFRFPVLLLSVGFTATLFCLLMWAQRATPGLPMSLGGFVASSISYATILIFGSLSGTMSERSGVVNIAIEGQFLAGAFCGALVGSAVGSAASVDVGYLAGGIAGIAIGALFGALLAYFALRFGANQVIVGIVLVILATGLTGYLNFQILDTYQNLNAGNVALPIGIPLLDQIPLLGPGLFDQNVFAYLADVLVVVVSFALFRTRWGLRARAVGEHPRAAETVGINVIRTRYKSVILGGAIAGLGGAYYTLGLSGSFSPGLTGGLGYIALAVMIFGQWRPYRCLGAALLFGTMFVLQATCRSTRRASTTPCS